MNVSQTHAIMVHAQTMSTCIPATAERATKGQIVKKVGEGSKKGFWGLVREGNRREGYESRAGRSIKRKGGKKGLNMLEKGRTSVS